MLTDSELEQMRATAGEALPGTAVIQRPSFVSDGGGGGSVTYSAAGTVACRLAPLQGDEREVADRVVAEATAIATMPAGTDVDVKDRLLIGGGTFDVLHIRERDWEITRRVEVVAHQ